MAFEGPGAPSVDLEDAALGPASELRKRRSGIPAIVRSPSCDSSIDEDFVDTEAPRDTASEQTADDKKHQRPKVSVLRVTQKLDRLLDRVVAFSSRLSARDKTLRLAQYILWFLSKVATRNPKVVGALRKLAGEISWARYLFRFFGLPAAIQGVRDNSWAPGIVGQLLAWSMVFYYPFDHAAYIGWKAPHLLFRDVSPAARIASKLSAWSCRFWLLYILVDVYRGIQSLRDLQRTHRESSQRRKLTIDTEDADADYDEYLPMQIRNEQFYLLGNLCFILPCLHWSAPNWRVTRFLSENVVNSLMFTEAIVAIYTEYYNFIHEYY